MEGQPKVAPNRVMVRFKQTPAAARISAVQAQRPLPGLQLERLVGKHHTLQVPPAGGGGGSASGGGATTSSAGSSTLLPPDAVMLFSITDGSSVQTKVAQLRANPGMGAAALMCLFEKGSRPCEIPLLLLAVA